VLLKVKSHMGKASFRGFRERSRTLSSSLSSVSCNERREKREERRERRENADVSLVRERSGIGPETFDLPIERTERKESPSKEEGMGVF